MFKWFIKEIYWVILLIYILYHKISYYEITISPLGRDKLSQYYLLILR